MRSSRRPIMSSRRQAPRGEPAYHRSQTRRQAKMRQIERKSKTERVADGKRRVPAGPAEHAQQRRLASVVRKKKNPDQRAKKR